MKTDRYRDGPGKEAVMPGEPPDDRLRVVVADPHDLLRRGLVELLGSAGIDVVAATASTDTMLRAVVEHRPDALVVSLALDTSGPGRLLALVRERWPRLAVVAMTPHSDDRALSRALQHAASAYVPQDAEPERLVAAVVQSCAAPRAFLAKDVLAAEGPIGRPRGPRLTPREAEVLALAAEGLTVSQISSRLYVSEATTKSHLAGIYRKLGVTSRTQAVLAASRYGMLRT